MATPFQQFWRPVAGVLGLLGIGLALVLGLLVPEPALESPPPEPGEAAAGPFQADPAEPRTDHGHLRGVAPHAATAL